MRDEKAGIVRDMTVDDGIGVKRRTIVHHRENTEPESVETLVVQPEEKPTLLDRVLGFLRGGEEPVAEEPEAQPSEEMEQLQSVLNDILGEPHG